jgi:hypothetical protein
LNILEKQEINTFVLWDPRSFSITPFLSLHSFSNHGISTMRVIPVTVGDNAEKARILTDSLQKYNHGTCYVLGDGKPWKGGTMAGPGGGQKINLMKEFLNSPPLGEQNGWTENDLILFSDGYDTNICGTPDDFIRKWKWFGGGNVVVFGAESFNWPGQCTTQPTTYVTGRFKYLNSGGYIGRASALREMFNSREIDDAADDQLFCQELYASGQWNVKLDHLKEIFCCLSDHIREHRLAGCRIENWPVKNVASDGKKEIYFVMETQSYPLQLHGNGHAKEIWREIIS